MGHFMTMKFVLTVAQEKVLKALMSKKEASQVMPT